MQCSEFRCLKPIALLASCIHLATGVSLPDQLLQYTISVIQHYYQQKPGWFKCTFYDLSDGTDEGLFGKLISSLQLDNVVKYVLDENFYIDCERFPRKQDLTVVFVGDRDLSYSKCPVFVRRFFTYLDRNSPLLVLLDTGSFSGVQNIGVLLSILEFDKLTYIGTKSRRNIQIGLFGKPAKVMEHFPHPKDLFRSNIRNAHGRPIGFTDTSLPWRPAQNWLHQTMLFLNTGVLYFPNICIVGEPSFNCLQKLVMAVHVDISLDRRDPAGFAYPIIKLIFNVLPISRVILVPQGRPFNALEMFTRPLKWETWIVFLTMIILTAAISFLYPTLFRNDPIWLILCGFERNHVQHTSAKEKLLILPIILFFFIMCSAYETKIIAFMTNKPSIGSIQTLDELAKSGLKITTDLIVNPFLAHDQLLGPLMLHKPINADLGLDGEHAHLSTDLEAATLISLSRNYDFKLNRPKYVLINERKSTSITTYWIGMNSPFAEMFYYTQKVFFEAGLFYLWHEELLRSHADSDRKNHMGIAVNDSGMLSFDDLVSLWILLAIGLLASSVVLGLELLLKYLNPKINL